MVNVLVKGGNGQLGTAIKSIAQEFKDDIAFTFCTSADLNITDYEAVASSFKNFTFHYCINCAAYTNVDAAEENYVIANAINGLGVKNLAETCAKYQTTLIHISTDFVFSGKQSHPYTETDSTAPLGVYGKSKLLGEQEVTKACPSHFIVRTSWLYSEFGHNFMKSMLRLGRERDQLSVVYDQIGTPTYAVDLARFVVGIIAKKSTDYGTYHYSNEGAASWYDFATAIFAEAKMPIALSPIRTYEYVLPAKRPSYSLMDKAKVKASFGIQIPHWQSSLKVAIANQLKKETREEQELHTQILK